MDEKNQAPVPTRSIGNSQENSQDVASDRKTHLLVFAAGKYTHWPTLDYPVQECELLIEVLKARYAIEEETLQHYFDADVSEEKLTRAIYATLDRFGENDNLIIVFSGHGHLNEDTGVGYWIPVEALPPKNDGKTDPFVLRKYFSVGDLAEVLQALKVCHLLLIVDSCFAGKFGRFDVDIGRSDSDDRDTLPENIPSRWAITSGLIEKTNDKSPFAAVLIQTLKENAKERLSLYTLIAEIEERIPRDTRQTPTAFELTRADRRGGRFFLRRRTASSETPIYEDPPSGVFAYIHIDLQDLEAHLVAGSRAHRETLEKSRFRFSIVETLLPGWQDTFLDIKVSPAGDTPDKAGQLLADAILAARRKPGNPHLLVTGEGGAGKTVSLLHLWKTFAGERKADDPIPLFIPLNEYNAAEPEKRRDFILAYLAKNYLKQQTLSYTLKRALYDLFKSRQGDLPRFLLLLDGFNEVTAEQTELLLELGALREQCPGLQIVATSRPDLPVESFAWARDFEKIALVPIDEAHISAYLRERNLAIPEGADLLELLGNPMMLTVYAGSSELRMEAAQSGQDFFEFKPQTATKGELLWNFAEAQLYKYYRDNPEDSNGLLRTAFLLRYLAPFIAYRMVQAGHFYLSVLDEQGVLRFSDLAAEAYSWFDQMELRRQIPAYSEQPAVFHRLDDDANYQAAEARSLALRADLVTRLNILVREGNTLRFQHQHFRDYFAARHVLNDIALSLEANVFPPSMQAAPLDFYVRQLLGEMEGEHSNKLEWDGAAWRWSAGQFALENKLAGLLDWCRGKLDREQVGYTVFNLLTIYIKARGELSGADLGGLDLRKDKLNNIRLSRPGLAANLDRAIQQPYNLFPQGHDNYVNSAVFSPDGQRILSASKDIRIWDVNSGQLLQIFEGGDGWFISAAFSPDGQRILSASKYDKLKIWDAHSSLCLKILEDSGVGDNGAFSPDGQRIISASGDNTLKIWDAHTGECLQILEGHAKGVYKGASPDGQRILSASEDNTLKIWDAHTGECLQTLEGHAKKVYSGAFSPDGQRILSASEDNTLKIWDAHTGQCLKTLEGHSRSVNRAVFSPDGLCILSASLDHTLKIWDAHSGQCLKTLKGHTKLITSGAFSPNGQRILSASDDMKIWDAHSGQCLKTIEMLRIGFKSGIFSPDGLYILSVSGNISGGGENESLKIWDVYNGQCLQTFEVYANGVLSAALNPEGLHILSPSPWESTLKIWDAYSGQCLKTLEGHTESVFFAAFSLDGQRIISVSWDDSLKIWDAQSGQCLQSFEGQSVNSGAFSPDGQRILTVSWDTLKIWDIHSGQCLQTFEEHKMVKGGVFSPDGQRILSVSEDDLLKIWDAHTGECLQTIEGYAYNVLSGAFSPDGRRIISMSRDDGRLKIWDAHTGECLQTLERHVDFVNGVFSSDGLHIISTSGQGSIIIWDAHTGEWLHTILDIPGLLIQGCDFSTVQWEEDDFSHENWRELLEMYGAKV